MPIKESDPVHPISPYGWHKLQSELLCKEFYQNFGIATCSLRIFSAFGAGLQKQLFWDWYQKILQSPQMSIYGTGNESRDFIYIKDLIHAIDCVVSKGDFNANIYNIANGKEIFIKDVIEVFRRNHRSSFTYSFTMETRTGDPINWVADISKLRLLGFQPQVSFEKGVEHILKWLQEEKG